MNSQTETPTTETITKIETRFYVDNQEIDFLQHNEKGRVTANGDVEDTLKTWDGVYVDMSSIAVDSYPKISFNKTVWVELNYKVTRIETIEVEKEIN